MTWPQSAIDDWGGTTTGTPLKVRYGHFSGTTDWVPCADVTVREGVLVIKFAADSLDMIPLHVVRDSIEVRTNDETTEEPT